MTMLSPFRTLLMAAAISAVAISGPANAVEDENDSADWKAALPFAKEGDVLAQCQLGELIVRGRDAHRGLEEAVEWFGKAAEKNALCALLRMGEFHRRGRGVKKDLAISNEFYARALPLVTAEARRGDIERQILLAQMYQRGWGTAKDRAKAGFWYNTAASLLEPLVVLGDIDAHKKLGNILIVGIGVKRDVPRAGRLYEVAAQAGDRAGQYLAGLMFFKGRAGHVVDLARGFSWLFQAAEQDHPRSQYLVGTGYLDGLGVEKSVTQAAMWFTLASDRGNADARKAVAALEKAGPADAFEAGIALADDWEPIFDRDTPRS